MRYGFFLLISAFLVGCVTTHVNEGLKALKGEPVSAAFQVLGYPTSRMSMGSDTLYSWSMNGSGVDFIPQRAVSTGLVGFTPVTITTNYTEIIPTSYSANIKILTNEAGIVKGSSWGGQIGAVQGCSGPLYKFAVEKRKRSAAAAPAKPSVATLEPKTQATTERNGTLYLR